MFYATLDSSAIRRDMPPGPFMLPASSWYDTSTRRFERVRLPKHCRPAVADCGGFVATRIWGDYRYSPQQYVDWLSSWTPDWAAMMDYCCEDEITAGKPGVVRERQRRTLDMAWLFWYAYRGVEWPWVPTVQGWTVDDYQWHADQMTPLLGELRRAYGTPLVGIGTLCRRTSGRFVQQVVTAVANILPDCRFHLWGVKLDALDSPIGMPRVASVDSGAWHGARDKVRYSNQPGDYTLTWKAEGMKKLDYAYYRALPAYRQKMLQAASRIQQGMLL